MKMPLRSQFIKDKLFKDKTYQLIPFENVIEKQRFALFRIFSLTGIIVCIAVFLKMYCTIENAGFLPWIILTLGIVIATNYFQVSEYSKLRSAYMRLIASSYLLLHIVSYDCGGIRTSGTFYFAVVILYAYMLLGKRTGNAFVCIAIAHVLFLYFISSKTSLTSFSMFKEDPVLISQDFLINAILVFLLIASQSNYLQSGRNIVISRLEESKKELEIKNQLLEENNILLKNYSDGLEKTNHELEKFASVASHDLKAPLRAISSLTSIIEDEAGDSFTKSTNRNFSIIKSRVNRMENLINSLLEYSKIKKFEIKSEPIDISILLSNIQSSLPAKEKLKIALTSDARIIDADISSLKTVLYHLMKNAIFFCDKDSVLLDISWKDYGQEWMFTVKDNGPGIDKQYHDKIFVLFQTLNRRDEVETIGAGLAICKKTIESIGGKIWVNSEPGSGAEFIFTIPK